MNKDNAHLFLPLVQALADGKRIQFRVHTGRDWITFSDDSSITWKQDPECYRVKPDPFECWTVLRERKGDPLYFMGYCGTKADADIDVEYLSNHPSYGGKGYTFRAVKLREVTGE